MIAIDGIGYDWSYMAEEDKASKNHALVADEEEVPTKYALMDKSSSSSDNEVYDDSFCFKSCRKNTKNLNTKNNKLNEELSDCETDLYNYKRGLSQVEARLVKFKENEIKYYEKIRVLERDIKLKDNKIEYLRNELEEGMGFNEYCAILPPPAQVYSPPKKDISWMGLHEFVDDTVTDYTRPTPNIDVSKSVSKKLEERWKSNNPSFFEQGGSTGNVVSKPMIKFVKESGCPKATKVNNTKNTRKPTMKYAEMYRNTSQSPRVRGNQRNWNNKKSQQLGKDFMMQNKACYNCGIFYHLEFNCNHDMCVDKGKT
nr:ribonuclease H-like domain-containing protein [Tanacetum cinerariifolium]